MKIYSVEVPEPSAKRMSFDRTLVFNFSSGWGGDYKEEYKLLDEQKKLFFPIPDGYDNILELKCLDGVSFDVLVVFKNSTGSRTEEIRLAPKMEVSSELYEDLAIAVDESAILDWLQSPNDAFNGFKPIEKIELLEDFVFKLKSKMHG
jgi:hypothetical protein